MLKAIPLFFFTTLCVFTLCSEEAQLLYLEEDLSFISEQKDAVYLDGHDNTSLPNEEEVRLLVSEQNAVTCSDKKENPIPSNAARPMRLSARYTSPKGIGYNHGYTTVEGFFSSMGNQWLGFTDLRGHVFDNGKLAANAGLGVRYLGSSRIWGANSYYDYRNTQHQHYNQIAVGFESLGRKWDVRLNGYLPVGSKQSPKRDTDFDHFKDHSIILQSKRDFALKGVDLEGGAHVGRFYFAAGPYYLNGKGATAWGGQARGAVDLLNHYVRIEANVAYDSFFHWTGQGQISVNIPLGKKRKVRCCDEKSCSKQEMLYTRAVQRVDRHEIIPVGKQKLHSTAINPATHEPYYVVFVDNTSSSLGTFESPYPSLALAEANSAENQIIYVFPGDGNYTNMNAGITLKNGQMLFGASIIHPIATTLGSVSIPAFASYMPILTNSVSPVITLANNNVVSGIYIDNTGVNGISGAAITNFIATQNTIAGTGGEGMLFTDVLGQLTINDNLFVTPGTQGLGSSIHIVESSGACSASFANNIFHCKGQDAITVELQGTARIDTLEIAGCALYGTASNGPSGMYVELDDNSSVSNIIISNTDVTGFNDGMFITFLGSSNTVNKISLSNCNIQRCADFGFHVGMNNFSLVKNISVSDCVFQYNALGLELELSGSSIENLMVTNSKLIFNSLENIFLELDSDASIQNVSISNCDLNGSDTSIDLELFDNSSITNMQIDSCNIFSNGFGNAIFMHNSAKITNVSVSNSTLTGNSSEGVFVQLNDSNSIENLNLSNCTADSNLYGIVVTLSNGSSITNCNISNYNANLSNQSGIEVSNAGTIQNLAILNSYTNNNHAAGINIYGGGVLDHLVISKCVANNNLNANGVSLNTAISDLSVDHSQFNGNNIGCFISPTSAITANVNNNTMIENFGPALSISSSTGSNAVSVTNNAFSTSVSSSTGYAATIANSGTSTLCLNFVDNQAFPMSLGAAAPFAFTQSGVAFNLTADSTQANNIGTISFDGATPNNCTLP